MTTFKIADFADLNINGHDNRLTLFQTDGCTSEWSLPLHLSGNLIGGFGIALRDVCRGSQTDLKFLDEGRGIRLTNLGVMVRFRALMEDGSSTSENEIDHHFDDAMMLAMACQVFSYGSVTSGPHLTSATLQECAQEWSVADEESALERWSQTRSVEVNSTAERRRSVAERGLII